MQWMETQGGILLNLNHVSKFIPIKDGDKFVVKAEYFGKDFYDEVAVFDDLTLAKRCVGKIRDVIAMDRRMIRPSDYHI